MSIRSDKSIRTAYSEITQEQKSEEKRPLTYKRQGREFEFGSPTSQAELNRLKWLVEKAAFRPDWQKEARRLLEAFEKTQQARN